MQGGELQITPEKFDNYYAWTVKEVRVNSQKHNLKVPSTFRKADIINLIIDSKYSG